MAFKILYHEDALADLEEIFSWSREMHPETTEQFANDLFNHLDFLQDYPYIGTPVRAHSNVRRLLHSPLQVYYRVDENREALKFFTFGTAPGAILSSETIVRPPTAFHFNRVNPEQK